MHIFSELVPIWFLFLKIVRTIIENTENIILVFSENYSCSLNLVFSVFSVFFITKKIEIIKLVLCILLVLLI